MTALPRSAHAHFHAAEGWLELGNHIEANEELEKIEAKWRVHPDVLHLRWQIYAKAQRWNACLEIGRALQKLVSPQIGEMLVAESLHKLGRTEEALTLLLPLVESYSMLAIVPYKLAVYASVSGRMDEAKMFLSKAIEAGGDAIKLKALNDPELGPLWTAE